MVANTMALEMEQGFIVSSVVETSECRLQKILNEKVWCCTCTSMLNNPGMEEAAGWPFEIDQRCHVE